MCNQTCSVCSKESNNLSDVGGGILCCNNPTTCNNSTQFRKVTFWEMIIPNTSQMLNWSLVKKDTFGTVVAEVYRVSLSTLYSTVKKEDNVFLFKPFTVNETNNIADSFEAMRINKSKATEWCEVNLAVMGYIT